VRTLIVTEFLSLDGVIDSPGGGDHHAAGWTFKLVDFVPEAYAIKGTEQLEAGALLLGRQSYTEFAPVWPKMAEFAEYNAMPKYVVSTTLDEAGVASAEWQPTTVLRSLDDVAALKQTEGGPILVHGSGTLAKALLAAGLVDRYHLLVFPLILGSGKRLWDDAADLGVKLSVVESETYPNGITKLVADVVR
jgi:dihydrofolate reductase